ncbi:hypothetical protein [Catellatospora methionotrophica]|uniref:hypothetical protein n=1 Tax=Catellatospora methionotrophica TaxID=121620 RepID=UPI0033F2C225
MAGLVLAVCGLVELPLTMNAVMPPVTLVFALPVALYYTVFVAVPGERFGWGAWRPVRRMPFWARATFAVTLLAPWAFLLLSSPPGPRRETATTAPFSLLAVQFGVLFALLSWDRLRRLGSAQDSGS